MTGLYIHIPFCASKCAYCDFPSFANMSEHIDDYIDALLCEAKEFSGSDVNSVFIGGGTPSCLNANQIEKLVFGIKKHIRMVDNCEFSIEANPNALTQKKCNIYKEIGINRMSIGLQSSREHLLKILGRTHTLQDFLMCYDYARNAGITNLNADIMLGLPAQCKADVLDTVKHLKDFEHVSAYSLKIEENTPFYDMYSKGEISLPHEDADRDLFYTAKYALEDMGFFRYEISNFAKTGCECAHNMKYWTLENYIGLGLGAHSCLNGKRHENTRNFRDYTQKNFNRLYADAEYEKEQIMLGLRTTQGIDSNLISQDRITKLVAHGLATVQNSRLTLTDSGFDVSNAIILDLWEDIPS